MSKFYTWPNDTFPFRLYLDRGDFRIFIIENVEHNYNWLKLVKDKIRPTDHFFVYIGWAFSDHHAKLGAMMIEELELKRENFFMMYNSLTEMSIGLHYNFTGEVINHNAWLDESRFRILNPHCSRKYDALYTARRTKWKRHYLAQNIENLACAAGGPNHGHDPCPLPPTTNDSTQHYTPEEIVQLINESRCGLSLSATEGASFSTSEYLLCGTPVVSTHSTGGRDTWFTSFNSVIVEDNPKAVRAGVELIISKNLNRERIRQDHLRKTQVFRGRFIHQLDKLFKKYNEHELNAADFFKDNFFHKMRNSQPTSKVISYFS